MGLECGQGVGVWWLQHERGVPEKAGPVAARVALVRGAWLGSPVLGLVPPLAVGQPLLRRVADLFCSIIIGALPLPLHSSDLGAKPIDLSPSALQLILKLYDSPLLLHQKAAAK